VGGLRPANYQLVPLAKLLLNQQRAMLICDGVGVGKTISAGFALTYLSQLTQKPSLVVCPPSLQEKWRSELRGKFDFSVIPVRSAEELATVSDEWDSLGGKPDRVYVMPSSLLGRTSPRGFLGPIVIDEIHHYRNPETRLWKAAKSLLEAAPYRLGLSATPINNSISDLAAELSLLLQVDRHVADALVADLWRPRFREMLYPILTRFSKERLGIHFAARVVRDIHIRFPEDYGREVLIAIKRARGRVTADSIFRDEITYFRLASSSPRAFAASIGVPTSSPKQKLEALRGVLDFHDDERVLVFCEFEETARELAEWIVGRPGFLMTGSVPVFEREEVLTRFRDSRDGVLVMTSVGTEGLDLQFCSTVVNFDLTWNPMVLEQRVGRVDRIGQEKRSVHIYNVVVAGSIDERIIRVLGEKLGLLSGTMLEPASVLGNSSLGARLWDEEIESQEVAQAEVLARSLDLSRDIIPDDYEVLDAIDARYCDVERLREVGRKDAERLWFRTSEISSSWVGSLTLRARDLRERIQQYL
jgi:SNF2 family DNA or RNA helicase